MHGIVAAVGLELTRRAAGTDGQASANLPGPWVFLIALLNIVIFLPLALLVLYTLGGIFPTLAMIEDANPNASYAELSSSLDDDEDGFEDPHRRKPRASEPASLAGAGLVVTSSLRSTFRQLYRLGGFRSLFRGLFCAWVVSCATATLGAVVSMVPFVPFLVGTLIANLALVQLHTAWVHIVISTRPVSFAFWRRMPPFRRTFDATKYVVLVQWLATTINQYVPFGVAWLVGVPQAALRLYNPNPTDEDDSNSPADAPIALWKHLIILATVLVCVLFVQFPAAVALVRVQASILPPEEDTVVPFDRSFGGSVEPAVINGSASVSIRDALRTFSRESWVRLYRMIAKVLLITFGLFLLMAAVIAPQTMLLASTAAPPAVKA